MDTLVHYLTAYSSTNYVLALGAYMALVRHLRYKRIRALQAKYPDPTLPFRNLNVAREIAANVAVLEFPYLNTVALEFALFKTYSIPSISKILAATRQFTSNCLKRADDTSLILAEMNQTYSRKLLRETLEGKTDPAEDLNDLKRSQMATERLNWIHGHYPIKQEDYLYTLALFILEPGSWIDRFEWRPLSELERNVSSCVCVEFDIFIPGGGFMDFRDPCLFILEVWLLRLALLVLTTVDMDEYWALGLLSRRKR